MRILVCFALLLPALLSGVLRASEIPLRLITAPDYQTLSGNHAEIVPAGDQGRLVQITFPSQASRDCLIDAWIAIDFKAKPNLSNGGRMSLHSSVIQVLSSGLDADRLQPIPQARSTSKLDRSQAILLNLISRA